MCKVEPPAVADPLSTSDRLNHHLHHHVSPGVLTRAFAYATLFEILALFVAVITRNRPASGSFPCFSHTSCCIGSAWPQE